MKVKRDTKMGHFKLTRHPRNRHRRPPCQNPPETLNLALTIAVKRHRNFVVELLNRAIAGLLFHAHVHAAVVQHASQIVFQCQGFLGGLLG